MRIAWLALAALMTAGGSSSQDVLGGGRLSAGILVRCEADDRGCAELREKTARLRRRDPAAEARAAVAAGDFRPGAVQTFGDPLRGGGWDIPGADCRTAIRRENIGKWHVFDDYVTEAEAAHTEASIGFIERYNRALLADAAYPDKDVCAVKGRQRARAYGGPVTSFAEAARTRRLEALERLEATGRTDFGVRDTFDRTALAWAVYNGDARIAQWLLARTNDTGVGEYRTPLAVHALNAGQTELARALVRAGGHPPSETGLCEISLWGGPPDGNKGCTWAGLLIQKGEWDLLAELKAERPELGYEAGMELGAALRRGDLETAGRLASLPPGPIDGHVLAMYLGAGAWRILEGASPEDLAGSARSTAESGVWAAAAESRQWEAFAFLVDYGAELNLLTPDRLAACRTAAGAGDVDALFGCVQAAATVRERFSAAVEAGDAAGAVAIVREVADPREQYKAGLAAVAFRKGDPALMAALVDAGLPVTTMLNVGYGGTPGDRSDVRSGGFYSGRLKSRAQAWATASGYEAMLRAPGWADPIYSAINSPDLAMLEAVLRRPSPFLATAASGWLERNARVDMAYPDDHDTSALPDRPPADIDARLRLLTRAILAVEGPMALEPLMRRAVGAGWDGLVADWVGAGFDFARAERPEYMLEAWAGFNGQCRPTTARLLAEGGLNWRATYRPEDEPMPIYQKIAATCRDSRTVAALSALGVGEVNEMTSYGVTALDEATRRNRTGMVAALRAIGGKAATELDPRLAQARRSTGRFGDDPDLLPPDGL